MNTSLRFGIITPSYAPDFERCRLLCQSIEQFVSPPVHHYIVVDRADWSLFQPLAGANTSILTKEEVLPWWIVRMPGNLWFSLKSLPIRGWLLQQIVKIAVARTIAEEVAVFVDSDVAFVRPFDFQSLVQGDIPGALRDRVRLYHEPAGNFADMLLHVTWHHQACKLLGLPPTPLPAPDYIDHVITWRRENVVQMCQHLERLSGRGWIETLCRSWHLSEYILYGTFTDQVMGSRSGHYREAHKLCHDYWRSEPMSQSELQQFMAGIQPEHVAVMISAKSGMTVDQYQDCLRLNADPPLERV
jgi:Family of unknown function (DUF6492)